MKKKKNTHRKIGTAGSGSIAGGGQGGHRPTSAVGRPTRHNAFDGGESELHGRVVAGTVDGTGRVGRVRARSARSNTPHATGTTPNSDPTGDQTQTMMSDSRGATTASHYHSMQMMLANAEAGAAARSRDVQIAAVEGIGGGRGTASVGHRSVTSDAYMRGRRRLTQRHMHRARPMKVNRAGGLAETVASETRGRLAQRGVPHSYQIGRFWN